MPFAPFGQFTFGETAFGVPPAALPAPSIGALPTTIQKIIPSYLYFEYNDDDDLQAFVDSYNLLAQTMLDWFNSVSLPVYTQLSGLLLDWVAEGLYGIVRPYLVSGIDLIEGPINTFCLNSLAFNTREIVSSDTSTLASDDVFGRVITWHAYKGDGKVFDLRWLKRRINRFLFGYQGTDIPNDQTYRISVTFGVGSQVNITILAGERTTLSSAVIDGFAFNTTPLNGDITQFVAYPPIPMAQTFKTAVENGILELPFQFTYVVSA